MSKRLMILFIFLLNLVVVGSVQAQTNTAVATPTAQMRVSAIPTGLASKAADLKSAFKEKLALIRDQRKKALAERIDTKLTNVNKKFVEKMTAALAKLTALLSKLGLKTQEMTAKGINTLALTNAINEANIALDKAKEVISQQATKEYTIQFNSENELGLAAGQTVKILEADFQNVRKAMIEVRQALLKVLTELSAANIHVVPTIVKPTIIKLTIPVPSLTVIPVTP